MNILDCVELKKHFPVGGGSWLARRRRHGAARCCTRSTTSASRSARAKASAWWANPAAASRPSCASSRACSIRPRATSSSTGATSATYRRGCFPHSPFRPKIQMVFQDPTDSLNPRHTAFDTIAEPLRRLARVTDRDELARRVDGRRGEGRPAAGAAAALPAPALRRAEGARRHRARGVHVAGAAGARRADRGARRLGAGDDTEAPRRPEAAARHELSLRVARSQRGAHAVRPRDRDVPRPHRRAGPHRGAVPQLPRIRIPQALVQVDPGDLRPPRRARGAGGRAAQPDRPRPQGVPLLRALPAPARALPHGGAGTARDRGAEAACHFA